MKVKPLSDLTPSFLRFTEQKGVLRCHKDPDQAQGLVFQCPVCTEPKHGVVCLLNEPGVPEAAKPEGRWTLITRLLRNLTLLEQVSSRGECSFKGMITGGQVFWE